MLKAKLIVHKDLCFGSEQSTCLVQKTIKTFFSEKNDVDLGVNITGELEGLKKNLDAYKVNILNMFFIGDFFRGKQGEYMLFYWRF